MNRAISSSCFSAAAPCIRKHMVYRLFPSREQTPQVLKVLITLTVALSLATPIVSFFLERYFSMQGPQSWLPLSLDVVTKGWIWQPLTYLFVHSTTLHISISFLISLFFVMFLTWFTGRDLIDRFGSKGFLALYLSAGVVAGLISLSFLWLFQSNEQITGNTSSLFALLVTWAMLFKEFEFSYLFIFRLKAKWIVGTILAISLLMDLSYGRFISLFNDSAGIIWGYLFGRFIWKLSFPFTTK